MNYRELARIDRRLPPSTWREGWKWLYGFGDPDAPHFFGSPFTPSPLNSLFRRGEVTWRQIECGPISVFVSTAAAADFIQGIVDAGMVDARFVDELVALHKVRYAPSFDRKLWAPEWMMTGKTETARVPPGTDFADAVILLEDKI